LLFGYAFVCPESEQYSSHISAGSPECLKRGRADHFAPVKVNKSLTLLFDDDNKFESHHLAFHVSDREFDAILRRIKIEKIAYGSTPWSLEDGKLNNWNGGRGVYFSDPNGHVLELMTVPQ